MYCHQCGKEVGNANYCPYCGAKITEPSADYNSDHATQQMPANNDAPSFGFAFLSFLIPIVGLILFIVWNKEYPLKAKSCLKGFIAGIVLYFVSVCCTFSADESTISHSYYFNTVIENII